MLAPTVIRSPFGNVLWPTFSLRIYARKYKYPDLHLTCVGKTQNHTNNFCLKNLLEPEVPQPIHTAEPAAIYNSSRPIAIGQAR